MSICERCIHADVCGEEGKFDKALTYCDDFLGWIPVSERLPNSQTEVIVSCCDDSADNIYRYTASGWITTNGEYWIVDNEINPYVIAWMPLPKPYELQESEG